MMDFELIGEISNIETVAVNLSIRERADLKARFGGRRWRKLKGVGFGETADRQQFEGPNCIGTRPTVWESGS